MDFKIMKCPVCGAPLDAGLNEKFIICRACDTPLRLNEDATSFLKDPEAFGYGFEKGRQRAQAEEEQRRAGERGTYYAGDRGYEQAPPRYRYQDQGYYNQSVPNQPYPGPMNYNGYAGLDPNVSDKDRWTTLIICIFLGIFGGHQFYVGNIGKGILYIFTCGLFGIGWFIDIICLLTGTFKDSNGRVLVGQNERNNHRYGNPYGSMPQRNYDGTPQQNYGSRPEQNYGSRPEQNYGGRPEPNYSGRPQQNYSYQAGYTQPGNDNYEEWARKMRRRRKLFLGLTIFFGLAMLGNLFGGNTSGIGSMIIFTAFFGYLYYRTPRP